MKNTYLNSRLELSEKFWEEFTNFHRKLVANDSLNKNVSYFRDNAYDDMKKVFSMTKVFLKGE